MVSGSREARDGTKPNNRLFRAERQANFRKAAQKEVLSTGRQQKDVERRRMEEYRKLCQREGIVSKRLQEYDQTRESASDALQRQLDAVDQDQSMTNAEKKRRKFSLKQKASATPISELKKERKATPMIGLEKLQAQREAERQERLQLRQNNEKDKLEKSEFRRQQQQFHSQRTNKGQPVMSGKVAALLNKLKK